MSEEYVVEKIKAALETAEGNRIEAQRLLIAQAVRDHALLLGLAKPHLKAIATHAVEFVARTGGEMPTAEEKPHESSGSLNKILSQVGLRVKAGEGKEGPQVQLSEHNPERQASTWDTIAGAFRRKKH
ncbi:MAG: hypothetical protein GC131_02065 [Alphaproteobacteria bacterium]|nr:hypothetical protein [Alphaproteobacteria bacterium]